MRAALLSARGSPRPSRPADRRQASQYCCSDRHGPRATAGTTHTKIKICGVTSEQDAELAAAAGADFIGMIMWPKARRAVALNTAKSISAIAKAHGAQAVGVFVDEDATAIQQAYEEASLDAVQLHGDGARAALADLPAATPAIYVMHVDASGAVQTLPPAVGHGQPLDRGADWLLLDSLQGGSGTGFPWASLHMPKRGCACGWLLAGGLTPDNVGTALGILRPDAVDVSSGVCGPDKLRKDPQKVAAFIEAVRHART